MTKEDFFDDFEDLLSHKVDFCLLSINTTPSKSGNYFNTFISIPSISWKLPNINDLYRKLDNAYYSICGVFLPATYTHKIKSINTRVGKGKNITSYLSFEMNTSLIRSSFIKFEDTIIHVDVIGSKEDGSICYLYKRADGLRIKNEREFSYIYVPHREQSIILAKCSLADIYPVSTKPVLKKQLEEKETQHDVIIFHI